MSVMQDIIDKWAEEEAPPISTIIDDYVKSLDVLRTEPSKRNLATAQLLGSLLMAKVMYDNGYAPIFENNEVVGYAPKDLNEMN